MSYTRGTPIPLFLTLSSSDPEIMDLLISQSSIVVRLRRSLSTVSSTSGRRRPIASTPAIVNGPVPEDKSWKAKWWPTYRRTSLTPGTIDLLGEISLPPTMNPSTHIGPFCMEVSTIKSLSPERRLRVSGPVLSTVWKSFNSRCLDSSLLEMRELLWQSNW
jgi:hypothetical protein